MSGGLREILGGAAPAPELLIFGGKGGVGKTTCASAAALALAGRDPPGRYALISTDPAHSVADCLGPSPVLPANLEVIELDAAAEHRCFMAEHGAALAEIGRRGTFLDAGDVDRFLALSLPGLDELMAMLKIAELSGRGGHRCLVIDTAPTGHALRLLEMPELLRTWLEAMDALLAKHRYMAGLFGGAPAHGAARAGDGCERFLEHLGAVFEHVSALLRDPARCRFVPVMLAEALSVAETADLVSELRRLGIWAPEVVVNRLVPAGTVGALAGVGAAQAGVLGSLPPELLSGVGVVWGLPLLACEPVGPELLSGVWSRLGDARAMVGQPGAVADPALGPPPVRGVLPEPGRGQRLLILAGKGGVGKTTMAAALALGVSGVDAPARTLVVSTDPAHSLADVLHPASVGAGCAASLLAPGLWAMELDARAEYRALVEGYRDELGAMLDAALPAGALAFDREALERIIDLAPPGIDEVMAVARVVELLSVADGVAPAATGSARVPRGRRPGAPASERFDRVVVDAAPTGHLLRLLQLPAVIEDWLRAIFDVLLKHRAVFRMPRLEARLVELSRGVKRLRTLLADASRAGVVAVTIPTGLALAETRDLVGACREAGVSVQGLIVNQVTPAGTGDPLADAVARREAGLVAQTERELAGLPMAVVGRGRPPRGVPALLELGRALLDRGAGGATSDTALVEPVGAVGSGAAR